MDPTEARSSIWDIVPRAAPPGAHVRGRSGPARLAGELDPVAAQAPRSPATGRNFGAVPTGTASRLRRRVRRVTHRYGWAAGAVTVSILVGLLIGRM